MRTKIKQQGFTLLEIMLVVSIIVIILGVAISKLGNTTGIAKTMRVQADVQAIKTQLQLYESMNGFFPTTEQGLQSLVTQPQNDPRPTRWYQLFKELPKDPWGSDYIYRYPGLKNPGRSGRLRRHWLRGRGWRRRLDFLHDYGAHAGEIEAAEEGILAERVRTE